jgi:hypothetical protein
MLKRGPLVTIEQLEPGDLLLSKATRLYGWLIAGLDRSLYTHAAIWTGEGVLEAVPYAVVHWSLPESVNAKRRMFVDVFRWQGADPAVLSAMVSRAREHEGKPYAMTDVLHMLHGIASSTDPLCVLRPKLPKLMAELREYESLGPRRGLTCSELVAKAFIEAGRPLHIELPTVEGTRSAEAPPRHADPELQELIALCRRVVQAERALNAGDAYRSAEAAAAGRDLYMITPKDLSRSPSLKRIGRLQRTEEILRHVTKNVPKPKPITRTISSPVAPSRVPTVPLPSLRPQGPQRLLYIAAAPGNRAPIDSDGELAAIRASLRQSSYGGKQIDGRWPALKASALDFADAVDDERPTLIHFAGHGSDLGLAAHDRTLDLDDLIAILGAHTSRVQLVVLNACNTAELALGLSEHVRVAIGMRGPIREAQAKSFASALYRMLGNGRTIRAAFEFARRELDDPSCAVLAAKHEDHAQLPVVDDAADSVEHKPVIAEPIKLSEPTKRPLGVLVMLGLLAAALLAASGAREHFQEHVTKEPVARVPVFNGADAGRHAPIATVERVPMELKSAPPPVPEPQPAPAPPSARPAARADDPGLVELRTTNTATGTAIHLKPRRSVHLHVIALEPGGAATLLHASWRRPRAPLTLDRVDGKVIVVIASERPLDETSPKHAELIRTVETQRRLPAGVSFESAATARGLAGVSMIANARANGVAVASISLQHPQAPRAEQATPRPPSKRLWSRARESGSR